MEDEFGLDLGFLGGEIEKMDKDLAERAERGEFICNIELGEECLGCGS